jgi:hypothetical protein
MIDVERHLPQRTSPRQAIVIDSGDLRPPNDPGGERRPQPWPDELRRVVFLDLLGALVSVNGATISVVAANASHARTIVAMIPPGIDLVTPPLDILDHGGRFLWAIEHHLQRAFTSVVAVAADLPALPARTVATALSALAAADVVAGPATGSGLYLLGIRDHVGLGIAADAGGETGFDGLTMRDLTAAANARDATLRGVERRFRLADDASLDRLRDAVAATPGAAPRTVTWLRSRRDPGEVHPAIPASHHEHGFARG